MQIYDNLKNSGQKIIHVLIPYKSFTLSSNHIFYIDNNFIDFYNNYFKSYSV